MDVYKISCRTCTQCGKLFSGISNLRRHERNVHNLDLSIRHKVVNYKCVKCELAFTRRANLKRHQYSAHQMIQPEYSRERPCPMCSRSFETSYALNRHKKSEHIDYVNQISELVFECNECGETYVSKNHLRKHLRERHFSDVQDYKLLQNVLPEFHGNMNVIKYSVLDQYRDQFVAKFTINLRDKNAVDRWVADFQYKNKITLKKESIHPTVKHNVLYLVKLGCHHNTRPKAGAMSRKNTNCEASIQIKLFGFVNETKNYAEVKLFHTHNHELCSLDFLRFRKPIESVKLKFRTMFLTGMTPVQALRQHVKDLEQQYGDEFYSVIGDRGICPTLSWAYNYKSSCLKNVEQSSIETTSRLIDYKENSDELKDHARENRISLPNSNESPDLLPCHSDSCMYDENTEPDPVYETGLFIEDRGPSQSPDTASELRKQLECTKALKSFNSVVDNCDSNSSTSKDTSREINLHTHPKIFLKGNVIVQKVSSPEYCPENTVESANADPDFTILNDFDRMNESIKNMAYLHPFLLEGLQRMISSFDENLKDPVKLNEALYAFGKS